MKKEDKDSTGLNVVNLQKPAAPPQIRDHIKAAIQLAIAEDRYDVVADLAAVIDNFEL